MGQATTPATGTISGSLSITGALPTKIAPPGYMGEFGNGLWRVFQARGTFVVPTNVSRIRVRVVGAGGGARIGGGGGGGGYAHGVFSVIPGDSYAVTVGQRGIGHASNPESGGTSSFGALISATGGQSGLAGGLGGDGIGGDFQASGGAAGIGGGGSAGSQLGNGGPAYSGSASGGGGVGGGASTAVSSGGGSPFGNGIAPSGGPDITGKVATGAGDANPINATIRFPFDGFTGGGGVFSSAANNGGIGCGGGGSSGTLGGSGGVGGGGGAAFGASGTGGTGGIGGGGGAALGTGGSGGPGLVIVEW